MESLRSSPKLETYEIVQSAVKGFEKLPEGTLAEKLDHLEVLLFEAGIEMDPMAKMIIKQMLKTYMRISVVIPGSFDQK
jgi:hypothetical protein